MIVFYRLLRHDDLQSCSWLSKFAETYGLRRQGVSVLKMEAVFSSETYNTTWEHNSEDGHPYSLKPSNLSTLLFATVSEELYLCIFIWCFHSFKWSGSKKWLWTLNCKSEFSRPFINASVLTWMPCLSCEVSSTAKLVVCFPALYSRLRTTAKLC